MKLKLKKADLILLTVLTAAAAFFLLIPGLTKRPGPVARLSLENSRTLYISLEKSGTYDFESGGLPVHIEVRDQKAAFVRSECPDHICEHYGWLGMEGDIAVCMPARAILTIVKEAENETID